MECSSNTHQRRGTQMLRQLSRVPRALQPGGGLLQASRALATGAQCLHVTLACPLLQAAAPMGAAVPMGFGTLSHMPPLMWDF